MYFLVPRARLASSSTAAAATEEERQMSKVRQSFVFHCMVIVRGHLSLSLDIFYCLVIVSLPRLPCHLRHRKERQMSTVSKVFIINFIVYVSRRK